MGKIIKKYIYGITLIFALISLFSCSKNKTSENTSNNENTISNSSTDTNFSESVEDLLSVDYKYFYDQLSSAGDWVQVDAKQLGLDKKDKPTSELRKDNTDFISKVFGINNAYAQTEEEALYLYVWKPTMELLNQQLVKSISEENNNISAGGYPLNTAATVYTPYSYGQWTNTDAGWYFKAATPQEEITSHYGRWVNDPSLGYVWVPGRVWAPAWVDWRVNDNYVAWTPVPPGAYIENNVVTVPDYNDDDKYVIVEKKYFLEPDIYKYRYYNPEQKVIVSEMQKPVGITVVNNIVVNKGPDPIVIEKTTGVPIKTVTLVHYDKVEDIVNYSNGPGIFPILKRNHTIKYDVFPKPSHIVSYKDYKRISKDEQNMLKTAEKENRKYEKEFKKENKEYEKELKKNKNNWKKVNENINNEKNKRYSKKDKDNEHHNRRILIDDTKMHKKDHDRDDKGKNKDKKEKSGKNKDKKHK